MPKRYTILLTICCVLLAYSHQTITTYEQQTAIYKQEVAQLNIDKQILASEIKQLETDINGLNELVRNTEQLTKTIIECTGYCSCEKCCGKSNGITASGVKVEEGMIATRAYPIGTKIYIPYFDRVFTVTDRTGTSKRILDIYFSSHNSALEFGRRELEIYILR